MYRNDFRYISKTKSRLGSECRARELAGLSDVSNVRCDTHRVREQPAAHRELRGRRRGGALRGLDVIGVIKLLRRARGSRPTSGAAAAIAATAPDLFCFFPSPTAAELAPRRRAKRLRLSVLCVPRQSLGHCPKDASRIREFLDEFFSPAWLCFSTVNAPATRRCTE